MRLPQTLALGLLLACLPGRAADLAVVPYTTVIELRAGERMAVDGQVTNLTGRDLRLSDIWLSIGGYPAEALETGQLLGDRDDIVPDRTASTLVPLFSIAALPGATGAYDVSFFAMDAWGNFSDPVSMNVTVIPVPEPLPVLMLGGGLFAMFARARLARAAVHCCKGG